MITSGRTVTITNTGKPTETSPHAEEDRVLRAKYLDWCSAQVADHFLALSPDEIFELAERSSQGEAAVPVRVEPSSPDHAGLPNRLALDDADGMSSYRAVVERVTEVLTQQLDLPTFDEWLELYRSNRGAVEARLLGFWRDRD
ncbi:MAG: hypothetical protein KFH98_08575 [Gemmatimonadetes bacterium]|nr:hypothetical protein [Gemmatimonadota bacterium]